MQIEALKESVDSSDGRLLTSHGLMRSTHSNRAPVSARVLLVDDNRDGVLARAAVLEELGYRVVPAHDGAEALACLEKQDFDLVITDFRMMPMDGLELIRTLRDSGNTIPVILLSGFTDSVGLRPETTGADVVLQKSAHEVAALIRHSRRLLAAPKKPAASQGNTTPPKTRARGNS